MKKVIISIATLLIISGVNAQEKEINNAIKAFNSNDISLVASELGSVHNQMNSNTIEPELKAKYYYLTGSLALRDDKVSDAIQLFGEMKKYEAGNIYSIRNKDTRKTEYYFSKTEAEEIASSGNYNRMKEESLTETYTPLVREELVKKGERVLRQAQTLIGEGKDVEAAEKLLEVSRITHFLDGDFNLFKYNAAISFHKGEDYKKALEIYKELIQDGYTGITTSWVGPEKETGEERTFKSKEEAEIQRKAGIITTYKEVKSPSVERDLYLFTLNALGLLKSHDPIIEVILDKNPNDTEIFDTASSVYMASGEYDLLLNKLVERTKTEPRNATNFFNMGVIYKESGEEEKAVSAFNKAVEIDPNYKDAYINLAFMKLKKEAEYVEIINANLGVSNKEKQTYKEYSAKRKALYLEALPYFEKAFNVDKNDAETAKLLRQAYQAAEMYEKEDQMREVENSLRK